MIFLASITDTVVDGLKYPLNDVKKLLCFGSLFTLINIIVFAILEKSINVFRVFAKMPENLAFKFSHMPNNDIYIIAGLIIINLIILLIIMGYKYNVIELAINKKEDLPGFKDIVNTFINGIKYLFVVLFYNITPISVFIIGLETLNFKNADYIVSLISLALFVVFNFFLVMALANMVDANKFVKAFNIREIINKIANLGWIKYIGIILFAFIVYSIIMVAINAIMMFILAILAININNAMIITVIMSIIEGLLISSYIAIFFNRVFGSIYREAIKY